MESSTVISLALNLLRILTLEPGSRLWSLITHLDSLYRAGVDADFALVAEFLIYLRFIIFHRDSLYRAVRHTALAAYAFVFVYIYHLDSSLSLSYETVISAEPSQVP